MPGKVDAKPVRRQPLALWGWSGVFEKQTFALASAEIERLYELIPRHALSIEAFAARLHQIRVDYLCGLRQDEFGPTRAARAKALRAIIRELDALASRLEDVTPAECELLAAELLDLRAPTVRREIDPFDSYLADKSAIEALMAAVDSVSRDLLRAGRAVEAGPMNELLSSVGKASLLLANLDSTTETDVILGGRATDLAPLETAGDILANLGARVRRMQRRLQRERVRLNRIRGPDVRVSFDLLVARICDLWAEATGCPVTANPYKKDKYEGRPQTESGRFVVEVAEALQPPAGWADQSQKDEEGQGRQYRAKLATLRAGFRVQAVHTAMRRYVAAQTAVSTESPAPIANYVRAGIEDARYAPGIELTTSIRIQEFLHETSEPSNTSVERLRGRPRSQSPPRFH